MGKLVEIGLASVTLAGGFVATPTIVAATSMIGAIKLGEAIGDYIIEKIVEGTIEDEEKDSECPECGKTGGGKLYDGKRNCLGCRKCINIK